jgi:hypothetical protein
LVKFHYLRISHTADPDLVKLLERNIIGTPGESMLYAQTHVAEKLAELDNPCFANLYLKEKLVGTVCFLKRNVLNNGLKQEFFYVRYFTFLDKFRSAGTAERKGKSSAIREEIHRLMNGEGLDSHEIPALFAYVDKENVRSRRLIEEFGFRKAGTFRTIPFTRFFPKIHKSVRQIGEDEWDSILPLLQEYYRDYSMISFDGLKNSNSYFVLEQNGVPMCGVQAIPDSWHILSLPGLSGKLMMNLIPKIPILRRLFDHDYKFVFLEYTFCRTGYEKHLATLFESVLAYHRRNSSIMCLDPLSRIYTQVHQVSLGFAHRIMGEKEIEIVVKSSNAQLPKPPFYVSGPDVL